MPWGECVGLQKIRELTADYFKALANPLRISILDVLRDGERSVNEITEKLNINPSNASQQLTILRHASIVTARKQGLSVYYSVVDPAVFEFLDAAHEVLKRRLTGINTMLLEITSESKAAPKLSRPRKSGRKRKTK
jgi:DNA-binding transcriptional ArsR family regulator